MGGTSFDVAIVVVDKPLMSASHKADGFHIATPMIEIRAIGAIGGSMIRTPSSAVRC